MVMSSAFLRIRSSLYTLAAYSRSVSGWDVQKINVSDKTKESETTGVRFSETDLRVYYNHGYSLVCLSFQQLFLTLDT